MVKFDGPLEKRSLDVLARLFHHHEITVERNKSVLWLSHPLGLKQPIDQLWSNALSLKVHYIKPDTVEKIFGAINQESELWDIRAPSSDTQKKLFNRGVIAEHNKQIVGFMFGQHLYNLFVVGDTAVRSDFRRMGIATEMLNLCVPKSTEKEVPIEIYVSVPSKDPSTSRFF